jgi:hypothetical protein
LGERAIPSDGDVIARRIDSSASCVYATLSRGELTALPVYGSALAGEVIALSGDAIRLRGEATASRGEAIASCGDVIASPSLVPASADEPIAMRGESIASRSAMIVHNYALSAKDARGSAIHPMRPQLLFMGGSMQYRQKKVIESFQRVQAFLGANPPPAPASYAEPQQVLEDVITKLGDHSTNQVSGKRLSQAEQRRQESLKKKLREQHLRPIAAIARAHVAETPGIEKALHYPPGNMALLDLIATSKSIRDSIEQYQSLFIKNGRPADFLAQLDAAIAALAACVVSRGQKVGRHVGARAGLRKELLRGRKAVDMLDTIVTVAFEGKDDVLAEWQTAKRVQSLPAVRGNDASVVVPADAKPDAKLSAA